MEKGTLVFYVVAGALGVASAVLAFAGEATKIKISDVQIVGGFCHYPKTSAAGLGYVSVLLLIVAQIVINALNGCFCCKRNTSSKSSNRSLALLCFVLSWMTFVYAFVMLMAASEVNNLRHYPTLIHNCVTVKPGIFSGAAVLVVATVSLGVTCHVLRSPSKSSEPWGQHQNTDIAMGHVQCPPAAINQTPASQQNYTPNSSTPVFVHEDTYRRQKEPP